MGYKGPHPELDRELPGQLYEGGGCRWGEEQAHASHIRSPQGLSGGTVPVSSLYRRPCSGPWLYRAPLCRWHYFVPHHWQPSRCNVSATRPGQACWLGETLADGVPPWKMPGSQSQQKDQSIHHLSRLRTTWTYTWGCGQCQIFRCYQIMQPQVGCQCVTHHQQSKLYTSCPEVQRLSVIPLPQNSRIQSTRETPQQYTSLTRWR